jgi:hypothetical protein
MSDTAAKRSPFRLHSVTAKPSFTKDRYEGTLTDAASAVRVDVTKGGARIRYTAQNHLNFDQLLTPVGSRDVRNATRIRRLGIIVADFDEVIRELD